MGFWHTGYIEFHEPTGFEDGYTPTPIVYHCQHCDEPFSSINALRQHRFECHPYMRPSLFISGVELGSRPYRIAQRLSAHHFAVSQCEGATVNGQQIALDQLGACLAGFTNDRVRVELSNEGVAAGFELLYSVAEDRDLLGVEQSLMAVARGRHLDRRAVEDFIAGAEAFTTASSYCDGVCQYLYGVLAKERSPDSSLTYDAYQEKFSQAADILQAYHRPLARLVRALTAFNFNHFEDAASLHPGGQLEAAANQFVSVLAGNEPLAMETLPQSAAVAQEDLLSDFETHRILRWANSGSAAFARDRGDIEALVRQDLSSYDCAKLQILLAEHLKSVGETTAARRIARQLTNSPTLGAWAERLIERLAEERENG